jgi:ABC-type amino acid transport substrate-binding protein
MHSTCSVARAVGRREGCQRRLRGRWAAAVVVWLATLPAFATGPLEIHLASDSWPPFTSEAEGERVAVDLVRTALDRAGLRVTTTIVDWKEVEAGIDSGRFHGSAAMWRSEARERKLLFSAPYLENRLVLVGRKGSDVSATRMSDLAGKRVAVVRRYAYGDEVEKGAGVLFIGGRNDQEDLDMLLAGDVEYMLVDDLVARYLATYQPDETQAKLEIGATPLARRTLHLALRRDVRDAEAIIEAFNREMREMLVDGTFGEILRVAWIRADIDGDGRDELVALADQIGLPAPGSVYDVFGTAPADPPEKERIFIQGSVFEGWDAVPDRYKGHAGPNDVTFKYGATAFTLKF